MAYVLYTQAVQDDTVPPILEVPGEHIVQTVDEVILYPDIHYRLGERIFKIKFNFDATSKFGEINKARQMGCGVG